jgi:hypothetical protein
VTVILGIVSFIVLFFLVLELALVNRSDRIGGMLYSGNELIGTPVLAYPFFIKAKYFSLQRFMLFVLGVYNMFINHLFTIFGLTNSMPFLIDNYLN